MGVQQQLENASNDLWMMSESDEAFHYIQADATIISEALLLQWSGKPENTPVKQITVDYLFRNMVNAASGTVSEALAVQFRNLVAVLKQELKNITVYRVGEVQVDVFIVGVGSEGKVAGLQTRLIET